MERELLVAYLKDEMGQDVELKEVNDTLFIKFDFLPYHIRAFVHAQPDYDASLMINIQRDCQCGTAYFLDANHFFNLMKRFSI